MPKKKNAGSLISELKRKTRRNYSSEEKIRIIIEGMRGDRATRTVADSELILSLSSEVSTEKASVPHALTGMLASKYSAASYVNVIRFSIQA